MMNRLFRSITSESSETGNPRPKRSYSRHKSSSHVMPSIPVNSTKKDNVRTVQIRVIFIHIGEIDTLNERYQADLYYEARWDDRIHSVNFTPEQQTKIFNENSTIKLEDLDAKIFWNPQLFIENSIGPISEQDRWFIIRRKTEGNVEGFSPSMVNLNICEHRRLRGVFWEKLELNHFPADVQDLTVSISTHHRVEQCELIPDEKLRSSINREAFFDQQEWTLYEHVATGMRQTQEEYSFRDENSESQSRNHPVVAFTCRAARRPGYYYWNGFCLIFLITLCSFCIFSIPPDLPQSRLQITCTLLLTSVTFRWVVNRSLPTISYLTTLDQYAIVSIMMLVILCLWHSIIAGVIFLNPETASTKSILPTNIYVIVDRYMFVGMFVLYILIHIALVVWLIFVPYKRRREMEYLDRQYAAKQYIQIEHARKRYNSTLTQSQDLVVRHGSQNRGSVSIVKSPMRSVKHSDSRIIMPNVGIFFPIKEERDEGLYQTMTSIDLREQDDVFFDRTPVPTNEQKSTAEQV